MRVCDIAISIIVDSQDPGTLYALTILLLDELASSMHHPEIDGASVVNRVRRTLVEAAHLIQTGHLLEIHALSLQHEVVDSVALVADL